jgi:hypothetical protein
MAERTPLRGTSEVEPPSINSLSLTEQSVTTEQSLIKGTPRRDAAVCESLVSVAQAEPKFQTGASDLNSELHTKVTQDVHQESTRIDQDSHSEQMDDPDGIISVTLALEKRASDSKETPEQDPVRLVLDEFAAIINDGKRMAAEPDDNKDWDSILCTKALAEFRRLFPQGWEREDSSTEAHASQAGSADPAVRFVFFKEVYLEFMVCVLEYMEHQDDWYLQEVRALQAKVESPGYVALEKFVNTTEASAFTEEMAEVLVQYLPKEWPQAPTLTVSQAKELHQALVQAGVKVKYDRINQFITYFARSTGQASVDKSQLAEMLKEFETIQDKNYPLFEPQNTILASCKCEVIIPMRWSLHKMAEAGATDALRAQLGLDDKDEAEIEAGAVQAKLEQLGYPNEGVSSPIGKLVTDLLRHFGPRLAISSAVEVAKAFAGILKDRHKAARDPKSGRSFECSLMVAPPKSEED